MNKPTLLILGLLGLLLSRPAGGEGRDLLVHAAPGGGDAPGLWFCRLDVRDGKLDRSALVERDRTPEGLWNELAQIPSKVALLTSDDADLVVVLAPARGEAFSREWAWVSQARFTYGPALPAGGRIAAMAGGSKGLWALGAGSTEPPASRPATLPATLPSTRPAGRGLTLYQLKGDWKALSAAWPDDLSVLMIGDVSMRVIDDAVYAAVRTRNNTVRLLKHDRDRWVTVAEIVSNVHWKVLKDNEKPELAGTEVSETKPPRHFKLLTLLGKPALWIQPGDADADPAGVLWTPEGWCNIEMPVGKVRAVAMDLVIVRDQPRLYYVSEDKPAEPPKLNEQAVSVDGKFVGKPQQIVYARKQTGPEISWIAITVMAVLTIVILNMVLRRRGGEGDENRMDDQE
ncbi:MAG: hypothetical protein ABSH20_22035 [Tepidisphaeraceae bacterium]